MAIPAGLPPKPPCASPEGESRFPPLKPKGSAAAAPAAAGLMPPPAASTGRAPQRRAAPIDLSRQELEAVIQRLRSERDEARSQCRVLRGNVFQIVEEYNRWSEKLVSDNQRLSKLVALFTEKMQELGHAEEAQILMERHLATAPTPTDENKTAIVVDPPK